MSAHVSIRPSVHNKFFRLNEILCVGRVEIKVLHDGML